jgi:flagellar biosynthesis/type III secretory pathway protein FliH
MEASNRGPSRLELALPVLVTAARATSEPPRLQNAHGAGSSISPAEAEMLQRCQALLQTERGELAGAKAALEAGIERLAQLRDDQTRELEEQLLTLALGVAGKILMQEVQAQRYQIEPIIKEALLHVPSRLDVLVRLNPEDYARCQMGSTGVPPVSVSASSVGVPPVSVSATGGTPVLRPGPRWDTSCAGKVRFVSDPGVSRAGCVLETCEGVVESSVEGHLDKVAQVLSGNDECTSS